MRTIEEILMRLAEAIAETNATDSDSDQDDE